MSFGYTMNKQGRGVCLNERGQSLVDAVYRSLGRHKQKNRLTTETQRHRENKNF